MKSKLAIIASICLIFVIGCKKAGTQLKKGTILVSQIINEFGSVRDTDLYMYDSNNRLVSTYFSSKKEAETFIYDNDDRVIESNLGKFQRLYSYTTPGFINVTINTKNNGVITNSEKIIYTLNSKQQIVKYDYLNGRTILFSYDENGNQIGWSEFDNSFSPAPKFQMTITFDDKKNPFSNVKGNVKLFAAGYMTNNLVHSVFIDNYTHPSAPHTIPAGTNTYVYNSEGYPISETYVDVNGAITTTKAYISYIVK